MSLTCNELLLCKKELKQPVNYWPKTAAFSLPIEEPNCLDTFCRLLIDQAGGVSKKSLNTAGVVTSQPGCPVHPRHIRNGRDLNHLDSNLRILRSICSASFFPSVEIRVNEP